MSPLLRAGLLLALLLWAAALLISFVYVPGQAFADAPDLRELVAGAVTCLVSIVAIIAIRRAARGDARATTLVVVLTLGLLAAVVATVLT